MNRSMKINLIVIELKHVIGMIRVKSQFEVLRVEFENMEKEI